jgi:hypothetical protein
MFEKATRLKLQSGTREPVESFEGSCPLAYQIGLPGLQSIEVRGDPEHEGAFQLILWKTEDEVLRVRQLSSREIRHLEHGYEHLNTFFGGLRGALSLSERVLGKGWIDVTDVADLFRQVINRYDLNREGSGIRDETLEDPSIMILRYIVDGLEDGGEMLIVGKAMVTSLNESLPPAQFRRD